VIAASVRLCSTRATEHPTTTDAALAQSEKKTSTDPAVNPDAAALAEFKSRVDAYVDMHKTLAKGEASRKRPQPRQDQRHQSGPRRAGAGDPRQRQTGRHLHAAVQPVFRRLLARS
jgi:hypothetical protein